MNAIGKRRAVWCVLWLASFTIAPPTWACSVTSEYVRPTNFELIQLTDTIVVATAQREIKAEPYGAIEFRVDKVMKGAPPKRVQVSFGSLGDAFPSDPNDISGSHPEGHAGPCNRTTFGKGKQYVLFLSKSGDTYGPFAFPFSRINEDYAGEDSLWVRTIRTYLEIQAKHDPMKQLEVLDALLQQKLKGPQTATSRAEAQDILDHLRSRSPWKPTPYLVQTYEALERGEQPKYGVRSRAADRENSAAQDMTDAMFGVGPPPDKMSFEEEKHFVLRSLVLGDHPGAAPLFERLIGVPRPTATHLGLGIRFFAKNNQYRRAYTLIETQAMRILGAISQDEAGRLIADILDAQRGDAYGDRKERWRSDSYVATAWPELALHLYWFQVYMYGEGQTRGDSDAIRALVTTDYRARPQVTLALAASYDDNVEKWAISELLNDAKRTAWEAKKEEAYDREDPALLPMQVLVSGYGDERDAALEKIACQSAPRRELLIDTLGRWGDSLDEHWFAAIAAMPTISDDERELVAKAVARLYARETSQSRGGFLGVAGSSEYELLEKIIRREEVTVLDKKAEPLRCAK